ncbi:hypothetical protein PSAC2689_10567 [Paraburkholderia sacchari]
MVWALGEIACNYDNYLILNGNFLLVHVFLEWILNDFIGMLRISGFDILMQIIARNVFEWF